MDGIVKLIYIYSFKEKKYLYHAQIWLNILIKNKNSMMNKNYSDFA